MSLLFPLFLLSLISSSSSLPSISLACNASRLPSACAARLANSSPPLPPNPAAADFILALFNSSLRDLLAARSAIQSILDSSSDLNRTNAALTCLQLLSFSTRRLSAASSSSLLSPDSRAWAAASLLYQYDCWSALKYVNSTAQIAAAIAFLAELGNQTSDGLSMLAALHRYGDDISLWNPPQTERDGYWDDPTSEIPAIGVVGGVPVGMAVNLTVCKEGECDYETVQAAVDGAPENVGGGGGGGGRFVIWIKKGLYDEIVRVPFEKTNLVFVGDGMGKTVITGDRRCNRR